LNNVTEVTGMVWTTVCMLGGY